MHTINLQLHMVGIAEDWPGSTHPHALHYNIPLVSP